MSAVPCAPRRAATHYASGVTEPSAIAVDGTEEIRLGELNIFARVTTNVHKIVFTSQDISGEQLVKFSSAEDDRKLKYMQKS